MADASKRDKLMASMIAKAQEDAAFKEKLLQSPKEAMQEACGMEVPDGIEIEVLEEKPSKLYLVLPMDVSDMELSDEMLEKVAGGGCTWNCY